MKIPLLTTALAAILGLALAGAPITAQAQTTTNSTTATAPAAAPAKATKAKGKKSDKTQFKGSITAIDASSVTVANTQKTLTLAITPKTVFKNGKIVGTAADFAVGDEVTGSYSTDSSGAMTANTLNKKAPKGAPATKPAPAAQ